MNEKAAVSKELNEKHRKILDGLLRIPENRECADCKSLGPRWASVNLGIFICMRCAGIHRSLGVHISKVRSATLDTWLPDQVIFIQSMGNEKSNAYWEADLPPNHDRVQIENFIRAKYVEKRWIPRDRKVKSPARIKEEVTSAYRLRPWSGDEHGDGSKIKKHHPYTGEKYNHPPSTDNKEVAILAPISRPGSVDKKRGSDNDERHYLEKADNNLPSKYGLVSDTRRAIAVPHKVSGSATGHQRSDEFMQRSGPVALKIEPAAANSMPVVRSLKDDYAAELFRIIFMGDSKEDSKNSVTDSIAWVEFDSDEAASTEEEKISSKSSEVEIQLTSKIEYISKDATSLTQHCSQEPQKDLKNKNPDPFDKSDTMDTYSIHHRRLAMLAQDEPFHMASLAISCNGAQKDPSHYVHQPRANGIHREAPQTQMPIAKIQTFRPANFTGSIVPYTTTSSIYRPATLFNSSATSSAKRPPSALPVSGHDYDFSHLTRGLFRRQ